MNLLFVAFQKTSSDGKQTFELFFLFNLRKELFYRAERRNELLNPIKSELPVVNNTNVYMRRSLGNQRGLKLSRKFLESLFSLSWELGRAASALRSCWPFTTLFCRELSCAPELCEEFHVRVCFHVFVDSSD